MKRFIISGLIGLGFILIAQVVSGEEKGEISDPENQEKTQPHRLFYLFFTDDPEHQAQARELQDLVQDYDDWLQVTGIVLSERGGEKIAVDLEDFRTRNGLSYKLENGEDAFRDLRVPDEVKKELKASTDFMLFVDARGERTPVGTVQELMRIISGFAPHHLPTEIEENTWGKIKVLFN